MYSRNLWKDRVRIREGGGGRGNVPASPITSNVALPSQASTSTRGPRFSSIGEAGVEGAVAACNHISLSCGGGCQQSQ